MKKLLASALMISLSLPTYAISSMDQHIVVVQNNETSDNFSLITQITRTEYRMETREGTCYRQAISGYRRVCDRYDGIHEILDTKNVKSIDSRLALNNRPLPGPEPKNPGRVQKPEPRPIPRPEPRPVPRQPVCHDEPVYSTEAYSCLKTVSVPYEVFDHQETANVSVQVTAAPASKPQTENCGIRFSLYGDKRKL